MYVPGLCATVFFTEGKDWKCIDSNLDVVVHRAALHILRPVTVMSCNLLPSANYVCLRAKETL